MVTSCDNHGDDNQQAQLGRGADNYKDEEKSPEMTVKALLNNQSGVGERVLVTKDDNHHDGERDEERQEDQPQPRRRADPCKEQEDAGELSPSTPPQKKSMKKTTRSPHLPAKVIPRKLTPRTVKKTSKTSSILHPPSFTIGNLSSGEEDDKIGKVKQARMTIEEKLRKEKRDKMVEEVRKPILMTPGSKRGRQEDAEWNSPKETERESTPGLLGRSGRRKMTQTPMNNFLVHQTPAERVIIHEKKDIRRKSMDMSSSSASPTLKKRAGRAGRPRRVQEVTGTLPMSAGKVMLLSKYFEDDQDDKMMKMKPGSANNNGMYASKPKPAALKVPMGSTSLYPEMSLQSDNCSKPIGRETDDHVTAKWLHRPMGSDAVTQHGTEGGGSHIGTAMAD